MKENIYEILAITSFLLFAGFLLSLTSTFLEYSSNNKPYNYLADPKNFIEKKKILKAQLSLLSQAKKFYLSIRYSIFQQSDPKLLIYLKNPTIKVLNWILLINSQLKSQFAANLKNNEIKELNVREIIIQFQFLKTGKSLMTLKNLLITHKKLTY